MDELIRLETLRQQLAAGDAGGAPTVIDVRGEDEYAAGHIPGARHVPADDLGERLAEIPRGRPVVTY
jgi:rhodanese-related sulfurtransferase